MVKSKGILFMIDYWTKNAKHNYFGSYAFNYRYLLGFSINMFSLPVPRRKKDIGKISVSQSSEKWKNVDNMTKQIALYT